MKEFVLLFSAEADIPKAFELYNDQIEPKGNARAKHAQMSILRY